MYVTNEVEKDIVAAGWHKGHGYGEEKIISPGQTVWVVDPSLGQVAGDEMFSFLGGEVLITPTRTNLGLNFQLTPGEVLHLKSESLNDRGLSIHFLDEPSFFEEARAPHRLN